MSNDNETHLGDGLYASHDGYQIELRAPGPLMGVDERVYLDPATLRAFLAYVMTTPLAHVLEEHFTAHRCPMCEYPVSEWTEEECAKARGDGE